MKLYACLFLGLLLGGAPIVGKDIRCVCNDRSSVRPNCGICGGVEAGSMELLEDGTGVACICPNRILLKNVSCLQECTDKGGWSGDIFVR